MFTKNKAEIIDYEEDLVRFCRLCLGKDYTDYWIDIVFFDTEVYASTSNVLIFPQVGIELFPKCFDVREELQKQGCSIPDRPENIELDTYQYADYLHEMYKYKNRVYSKIKENILSYRNSGKEPIKIIITAYNIYPNCNRYGFESKYEVVKAF